MPKLVPILTALCAMALLAASCEIEEIADPGVTPTLGPAPETGIERSVAPEPTVPPANEGVPQSTIPNSTTTLAPAPTTTGAPPTTTTVPTTTQPPTTTAAPTTTTTSPPTTTVPVAGSPIYFNDFSATDASDRLDQFVAYRDSFVVSYNNGASDHAPTGDGVACGAPETTRSQSRDNPYGHAYLCHPGGDPAKGHQMAYAMDSTGYGFVGALPDQVFSGAREVRVDVNTTTAGFRNFVEIKVLPANETYVNALPCGPDVPCNDGWDYDDIGGVAAGTNAEEGTGLTISTPARPDGYQFSAWDSYRNAGGDLVFPQCGGGYCQSAFAHGGNTDIRARYTHVFRDNGDGTLSFGIQQADGTYAWVTAPGSFPSGDVRVVVAFHNYTGTKDGSGPGFDGNASPSQGGFTWHWDNLTVYADTSTPSIDYYGGTDPDRMATPDGCISFSQGQRNTPWGTDILPRFECG